MIQVTTDANERVWVNVSQIEVIHEVKDVKSNTLVYQIVFSSGRWLWIDADSRSAIERWFSRTPAVEAFVRHED